MTLEEQLRPIIASINTNRELSAEQATSVYVPMILAIVRERIVDAAHDAWVQASHTMAFEHFGQESHDPMMYGSDFHKNSKAQHFVELSKTL